MGTAVRAVASFSSASSCQRHIASWRFAMSLAACLGLVLGLGPRARSRARARVRVGVRDPLGGLLVREVAHQRHDPCRGEAVAHSRWWRALGACKAAASCRHLSGLIGRLPPFGAPTFRQPSSCRRLPTVSLYSSVNACRSPSSATATRRDQAQRHPSRRTTSFETDHFLRGGPLPSTRTERAQSAKLA